tara:strand:- start:1821 stop:2249 length:429 start_codon:yes stop_codon:yes gene_type:complete
MNTRLVHGTSLIVRGKGFLIQGPSAVGKSDLALRLLYEADGILISDDYTDVKEIDGKWQLSSPKATKGILEVRGLGLVVLPDHQKVETGPLDFVITLSDSPLRRLPEPEQCSIFKVPLYSMTSFEPSLISKILVLANNLSFL